jgi:tetratricopeptide (TPR) repeat protein
MLRQVAYDTLSRRDRKARHLVVATHLRQAFPGDGEEVADVIARHYLDALHAVPDDPDTGQIRGQAIAALIRAADRADRTGAPSRAAASYASAAELTENGDATHEPLSAGTLWERAAEAATNAPDYATALAQAGRARAYYLRHGQDRDAARVQVAVGRALRLRGRYTEAGAELIAAMEVLRADPDTNTVRALEQLATLEVFAGSPDADRLTTEALVLGQDLDVDLGQFAQLLCVRGIYLNVIGRRPEAVAYFRESARLATQVGDNRQAGTVLLNLSDALVLTDPAAAAETARTAAWHLRRTGAREYLAWAIGNLVQALLMLGEWDAAEQELSQAMEADGLADVEYLTCHRGQLAALRGDAGTARTCLAALKDMRASEDPQEDSLIGALEAFTAAARRQPRDALRHARRVLTHIDALGISNDGQRWAWPLAARSACELNDAAATGELLALLDSHPPGRLAPMLRAERDLVRSRLAARDGDPNAGTAFAAAVTSLRERSTPYHLAHGLLDYAEYLTQLTDTDAAALAIGEARDIGDRLRCQPLLDRADALDHLTPRVKV